MTQPEVSVVVVSRDRPDALHLCLLGLTQLYYPNFEIIVVANQASMPAIAAAGLSDAIKVVPFEEANISAARNAGVAASGGEIIAFIDDDAVPEPTWLDHLVAALSLGDVAAAGGYVIGRNGISFQWKGRMAFADGQSVDLPLPDLETKVFVGEPGRAIHTEGTNMAVRRDVLDDLGGFDEAFRFYLDETDLNMRIAARRLKTAIVPRAQVHHGYAASARRTAQRAPTDLTDIGRSTAVFARKHGADLNAAEVALLDAQRIRLLRFMRDGMICPEDVRRLMKTLKAGLHDGRSARFGVPVTGHKTAFKTLELRYESETMTVRKGRFWQKLATMRQAKQIVLGGKRVSLFHFSATTLYHRVRFVAPGIWVQTGGQFGRSERNTPVFIGKSSVSRVHIEMERLAGIRTKSEQSAETTMA